MLNKCHFGRIKVPCKVCSDKCITQTYLEVMEIYFVLWWNPVHTGASTPGSL